MVKASICLISYALTMNNSCLVSACTVIIAMHGKQQAQHATEEQTEGTTPEAHIALMR